MKEELVTEQGTLDLEDEDDAHYHAMMAAFRKWLDQVWPAENKKPTAKEEWLMKAGWQAGIAWAAEVALETRKLASLANFGEFNHGCQEVARRLGRDL